MKKILFITSRYLPAPSSNGINSDNIIKELIKRGHIVDCLSVQGKNQTKYEIIDGIEINRVSESIYSQISDFLLSDEQSKVKKFLYKILRLLRSLKLLVLTPIFPNVDIIQTFKVYSKIKKMYKARKYDCIIGVFKPPSNIEAIKIFKKKHNDVAVCGYYLDLITSFQKPKYMPNSIYRKLIYKGSINSIAPLDFALIAKSGEKIYANTNYSNLNRKIYYIDFPTLKIDYSDPIDIGKKQNKDISMTFAGTLDQEYRNPEVLLRSLSIVSEIVGPIELNMFGGGNCTDIIAKYKRCKNLTINNYGYRPHHEVLDKMKRSDFLINISNLMAYAVPSKIFEIFSFGKPIINLRFDEDDITNSYFLKYPSVCTINASLKEKQELDKLANFIKHENGKAYDRNTIKNYFKENTPEFTVDIIERVLLKYV